MAEETVVTADTPRAVLVAQSDDAYERPSQPRRPARRPARRLCRGLVAEAKLVRYDREKPFEIAGLVWAQFEDEDPADAPVDAT